MEKPAYYKYLSEYKAAGRRLGIPDSTLIASTKQGELFAAEDEIEIAHVSKPRGCGENRRVLTFASIMNPTAVTSKGYVDPARACSGEFSGLYFLDLNYSGIDPIEFSIDREGNAMLFDCDSRFIELNETLLHKVTQGPQTCIDLIVRMYWLGVEKTIRADKEKQ